MPISSGGLLGRGRTKCEFVDELDFGVSVGLNVLAGNCPEVHLAVIAEGHFVGCGFESTELL